VSNKIGVNPDIAAILLDDLERAGAAEYYRQ
jgi:hypothetical protein